MSINRYSVPRKRSLMDIGPGRADDPPSAAMTERVVFWAHAMTHRGRRFMVAVPVGGVDPTKEEFRIACRGLQELELGRVSTAASWLLWKQGRTRLWMSALARLDALPGLPSESTIVVDGSVVG